MSHSRSYRLLISITVIALAAVGWWACGVGTSSAEAPSPARAQPADMAAFDGYWSQGQAEITSYQLEQARYGEVHRGEAVMIFVTEDFSRQKHVKLDRPRAAGADRARILKLNATRKFATGVYPYSIMTSVFTALDGSGTLKVTMSAQEWCGHVFAQLNRLKDGWRVLQRSYFESEGDVEVEVGTVHLEDELWTQLRLDPASLPTGEFDMLPSAVYLRLRHLPWKPMAARAERRPAEDGLVEYRLDYPAAKRSLSIFYRDAFPWQIEQWQETSSSGFGPGAVPLTTRAELQERLMLDYWNRNSNDDLHLRQKLGLD